MRTYHNMQKNGIVEQKITAQLSVFVSISTKKYEQNFFFLPSADESYAFDSGVARLPNSPTNFLSTSSMMGVNPPLPVRNNLHRSIAAAFLDFFLIFSYAYTVYNK